LNETSEAKKKHLCYCGLWVMVSSEAMIRP